MANMTEYTSTLLKLDTEALRRLESKNVVKPLNKLVAAIVGIKTEVRRSINVYGTTLNDIYMVSIVDPYRAQLLRYVKLLARKVKDKKADPSGLLETLTLHQEIFQAQLDKFRFIIDETYYFYAEHLRRHANLPKGWPGNMKPADRLERSKTFFTLVDEIASISHPEAVRTWKLTLTYVRNDWKKFLRRASIEVSRMYKELDVSAARDDVDVINVETVDGDEPTEVTAARINIADFANTALALLTGEAKLDDRMRAPTSLVHAVDADRAGEILWEEMERKQLVRVNLPIVSNALKKHGYPQVSDKLLAKRLDKAFKNLWHAWHENAEKGIFDYKASGDVDLARLPGQGKKVEFGGKRVSPFVVSFNLRKMSSRALLTVQISILDRTFFTKMAVAFLEDARDDIEAILDTRFGSPSTLVQSALRRIDTNRHFFDRDAKRRGIHSYEIDLRAAPGGDNAVLIVEVAIRDVIPPELLRDRHLRDQYEKLVNKKQIAQAGTEAQNLAMAVRVANEYEGVRVDNTTRDTSIMRDHVTTRITTVYSLPWRSLAKTNDVTEVIEDTIGSTGYGSPTLGVFMREEDDMVDFLKEAHRRLRISSVCGTQVVVVDETEDAYLVINAQRSPRDPKTWLDWEPTVWIRREDIVVG